MSAGMSGSCRAVAKRCMVHACAVCIGGLVGECAQEHSGGVQGNAADLRLGGGAVGVAGVRITTARSAAGCSRLVSI